MRVFWGLLVGVGTRSFAERSLAGRSFSAEFADISCGGLGSPDGYTTVIVRTAAGENLYQRALASGRIKELSTGSKAETDSRTADLSDLVASWSQKKRERAASTLRSA